MTQPNTILDLPRGPRPGDRFTVEITDIFEGGLGFASVPAKIGPQHQPRIYRALVPKTIPGDIAAVEIQSCRKGEINARVVEILRNSPDRITPRCKHFGFRHDPNAGCGGCVFQNLSPERQRDYKANLVRKYFANTGLADIEIQPTLATPSDWYYRNKMEFSFGPTTDGNFGLGMHPNGYRYDVIRQEECFLMSDFIADFVTEIRGWAERLRLPYETKTGGWLKTITIREGKRTGERMVELVTNHADNIDGINESPEKIARLFRDEVLAIAGRHHAVITSIYWTQHRAVRGEPTRLIEHLLHGNEFLVEELHLPGNIKLSFDIHPRAFFQPNTFGAETIYSEVMRQGKLLNEPADRVLDLYCGTGTIALTLSHCAHEVVGVELQPDAVENAKKNAIRNGVTNATFICGDVGEVLSTNDLSADVIVVDPPRVGLLPFAHEQLQRIPASRLVYVSCKPSSLARDTRLLLSEGWEVERVQPIDQFPQTYHVETVASFRRS